MKSHFAENKELELSVENVLGDGDVGKQNFYTLDRAKSDVYEALKNDDVFVMGTKNGAVIQAFLSSGESGGIDYSIYKTPEDWENNIVFDGGVITPEKDAGISFSQIESILNEFVKISGYEQPSSIDFTDLAKIVVEKDINYSSYASDLFLPNTEEVRDILSNITHPNNITSFHASDTGEPLLEIPFGFDEEIYQQAKNDAAIITIPSSSEMLELEIPEKDQDIAPPSAVQGL